MGTNNIKETTKIHNQDFIKESNIWDVIHPDLDQKVFNGTMPRPRIITFVKKCLTEVMGKYFPDPESLFKLYITGSLTTYQYNETSDMDISYFPDYENLMLMIGVDSPGEVRKELIKIVIDEVDGRFVPGTEHPIQDFIVPPNTFPQDMYKPGLRSAWDVENHVWFVAPEKDRVHDISVAFPVMYQRAEDMADKMESMLDHDPIYAKLLYKQIHRKRSLDQAKGLGDFSEGNVIYKYLLQKGLFDRLKNELGIYIAKVAGYGHGTFRWGWHNGDVRLSMPKEHYFHYNMLSDWNIDLDPGVPIEMQNNNTYLGYGTIYSKKDIEIDNSYSITYGPSDPPGNVKQDVINAVKNTLQKKSNKKLAAIPFWSWIYNHDIKELHTGVSHADILNNHPEDSSAETTHGSFHDSEVGVNPTLYHDYSHTQSENRYDAMDIAREYADKKWNNKIAAKNLADEPIKIIYDFQKDRIFLGTPGQAIPQGTKIVGEYDGTNVHLYSTGQEFMNSNYFKRLWMASFPTRPLVNIYFEGEQLATKSSVEEDATTLQPRIEFVPTIKKDDSFPTDRPILYDEDKEIFYVGDFGGYHVDILKSLKLDFLHGTHAAEAMPNIASGRVTKKSRGDGYFIRMYDETYRQGKSNIMSKLKALLPIISERDV